MVLAILWPGIRVTLADRSARKARFLQRTAASVGLVNAEVKCHDVEVDPLADRYDFITSRAVAPVAKMWPWVAENLVSGGVFVHMSHVVGSMDLPKDLSMDLMQCRTAGGEVSVVLRIPGLDSRHVVTVVRKTLAGDQSS
jgi:16S rRNA (guanine527-N7)-methyltransferase